MTPTPSTGPRYPLASVDHALHVVELLRTQPSMRLSDVARELGVANSTAHRLLAALIHRRFVTQDEASKRYSAGDALIEIGRASLVHRTLSTTAAAPLLAAVVGDLQETAHLCVREGTNVRYVAALESARAVRVASRAGRTLPAHCTSTGKVLLAALDDEAVTRLYDAAVLTAPTVRTITDVAVLLAELERCRADGYAMNVGESELDVGSIAVGLADPSGTVIAAVGCAAPVHRFDPARAGEVAERLLQSLGAPAALLGLRLHRAEPDRQESVSGE